MKEDNFAARVAKKVNKAFAGMEKAEYDKEPYYAHPTFYINNLSEYIQLVTSIASINKDDLPGETVVFRGMVDSEYDLSPGLARLKNIKCDTEKELINEFLTSLGMGADFRYSYSFSIVGLLVCILVSAASAMIATYKPFAKWKKERDALARKHLGE